MQKYNILILSNPNDIYAKEDEILADSFRKDGNNVVIKWLDYDESLDNTFDVVLKRDTWAVKEQDIPQYEKYNNRLKQRLKNKPIKKVNFYEVGCNGKKYLIDYYTKGLPVIPSFDNLKQAKELKSYEEYILKPLNSFGSAFGQKSVNKEELEKEFKAGLMIQPKIKFKSEVQCYFVEDELLYTFEFNPSKYPDYPEPTIIELTKEEKDLVYKFVNETNIKVGFQRIDFLRLEDDRLLLLEIEANATFMDLVFLEEELRNQVIEKYKQSVYKYLSE
ncbi:MAG TPA: hypothetical protein DEP51_05035 [Clostridiales bacterium]|nr:hypothetical protein [Clostridiales bacterium]